MPLSNGTFVLTFAAELGTEMAVRVAAILDAWAKFPLAGGAFHDCGPMSYQRTI